jgi:hypothetical protein
MMALAGAIIVVCTWAGLARSEEPGPAPALGPWPMPATVPMPTTAVTFFVDVAGAELHIDGQLIGKLPLPEPLELTASKHWIVVHAIGYEPTEGWIKVPEQEKKTYKINLKPATQKETPTQWQGVILDEQTRFQATMLSSTARTLYGIGTATSVLSFVSLLIGSFIPYALIGHAVLSTASLVLLDVGTHYAFKAARTTFQEGGRTIEPSLRTSAVFLSVTGSLLIPVSVGMTAGSLAGWEQGWGGLGLGIAFGMTGLLCLLGSTAIGGMLTIITREHLGNARTKKHEESLSMVFPFVSPVPGGSMAGVAGHF